MPADPEFEGEELSQVPFGRNGLARALGASLFGAVSAALLRSAPAGASHAAGPSQCGGTFRKCHNCYGEYCTSNCTAYSAQCPSGTHCWNTCYNHQIYRCCDYRETYSGGTRACSCASGSLGFC